MRKGRLGELNVASVVGGVGGVGWGRSGSDMTSDPWRRTGMAEEFVATNWARRGASWVSVVGVENGDLGRPAKRARLSVCSPADSSARAEVGLTSENALKRACAIALNVPPLNPSHPKCLEALPELCPSALVDLALK